MSTLRVLALHIGLGVFALFLLGGSQLDKYFWCNTPHGVAVADRAAFGAWCLAAAVIVLLCRARRPLAWLVPLAWAAVATAAVGVVVSNSPAINCF